jgi:DNA end-binding protein Ku
MAARSIWNGTVAFGLVNVPVKLYAATESMTVSFSEVHARARVEHRASARRRIRRSPTTRWSRATSCRRASDAAAIDPVFHDRTYYAGAGDAPEAYRLL